MINVRRPIKARIDLPCSVALRCSGLIVIRGVTEELSRESLVIIAFPALAFRVLCPHARIRVTVELPNSRLSKPRLLQCSATVSAVSPLDRGLRIEATVQHMSIQDRDLVPSLSSMSGPAQFGVHSGSAIAGSRNHHVAVLRSRSALNSKQDYSMAFLRKLSIEEDVTINL